MPISSYGQDSTFGQSPSRYPDVSFDVRVVDTTTLVAKKTRISLWGVEKINVTDPVFYLRARNALEQKVGNNPVLCTVKNKESDHMIKAQCINSEEEDLSLFLLQNGYVSADRTEIYGSIYEKPYLSAERQAQLAENGAWEKGADTPSGQTDTQHQNFLMIIFFSVVVFILGFGLFGFRLLRGFGHVVRLQNQSINLAAKERSLRNKEKHIIASMLHAEIKSNKAKIDAYLMVYEEALREFKNPDDVPKYKKTGDIIQKQPLLDRAVFDGNTDKLDLFGAHLASDIIHYYARIKTSPDYIEVTPDMQEKDVLNILGHATHHARKLGEISDTLLEKFKKSSLVKSLDSL